MSLQSIEIATLLARRELWSLVSVGFVDPHHRQRFEVLRDPAFRRRTTTAAAFLAQQYSDTVLGIGEVNPNSFRPKISSRLWITLLIALSRHIVNYLG
ncbi:MAG: hypothetical protein U0V70_06985 [Terriglobia bacterium]